MPVGQAAQSLNDRVEIAGYQIQRVANPQHQCGVDDILRGRALMEGRVPGPRPAAPALPGRTGSSARRRRRCERQARRCRDPRAGSPRSPGPALPAPGRAGFRCAPGRPPTRNMLPTQARSEKQARMASVANNGPNSSESRGEKLMASPPSACRVIDDLASCGSAGQRNRRPDRRSPRVLPRSRDVRDQPAVPAAHRECAKPGSWSSAVSPERRARRSRPSVGARMRGRSR